MQTHLHTTLVVAMAALGVSWNAGAEDSSAAPVMQASKNAASHQHGSLGKILHELHEAKRLLHTGAHAAHKQTAKASEEISKAIHLLEHHHHAHHKAGKGPAAQAKQVHAKPAPQGSPTAMSLSGAESKLRQSEKLVRAALHQLHHHHQGETQQQLKHASHFLKEAVQHIEAARHTVEQLEKRIATRAVGDNSPALRS